ncbi:hypothetical protein EBAPG3_010475 [Nitrosospira lacus]|uniref:ArsR family transcriptional regulator n=1 Tax=Nitrosospira lacus TaxID=1288494 RepID=A0A1W6SQT6_9PROT|nr:hypothetical protein [Nitrosospira lacus]ARO88167.1 hypothetical protein EBAPG3_010475 [Nitrosospira lacus]
MTYSESVAADRRLLILRALRESHEYTAAARLLRVFLGSFGRPVSADLVESELAWLAEQGLVTIRAGGETIATLTPRGADAANGLTRVPGVRRPEPGE